MESTESIGPDSAPRVSVVIPTRNRPDQLARCLESIAAQTFPPAAFETIVVDDGSDPLYQSEIDKLQARFSAVRFERREHHGPAAARNHGIRAARGTVVAFTDDDCEAEPGWLESLMGGLAADATAKGVEGAIVAPQSAPIMSRFVSNSTGGRYLTANVAYLRSALVDVGGFDEGFPYPHREDTDVALRVLRLGNISFAPRAVVRHPAVRTRFGDSVSRLRYAKSDLRLYWKDPSGYHKAVGRHPLSVALGRRVQGVLAMVAVGIVVATYLSRLWPIGLALGASALWCGLALWLSARRSGLKLEHAGGQLPPFVIDAVLRDLLAVPVVTAIYISSRRRREARAPARRASFDAAPTDASTAPELAGSSVTVVIPTRNRVDLLARCLTALCAQTVGPQRFKVIVVDDASDDPQYLQILEAFRGALSMQGIRRDSRGGSAAARETAFRHVETPIVAFTDDDCIPEPTWLEEVIRSLSKSASTVGVEGIVVPPASCGLYEHFPQSEPGRSFLTANVAYRTEALRAVGGPDPRIGLGMGSDTDMGLRVLKLGDFATNPRMRVAHPPVQVAFGFYIASLRRGLNYFYLKQKSPETYWRTVGRSPVMASFTRRTLLIDSLFFGSIFAILTGFWILGVLGFFAIPAAILFITFRYFRNRGIVLRLNVRHSAAFCCEILAVDLIRPARVARAWAVARRQMRTIAIEGASKDSSAKSGG